MDNLASVRVYFIGRFAEFPAEFKDIIMQERRQSERYPIAFPIRVKWKDESGSFVTEEGLTENVGIQGALVYLPRKLPTVGSKVELTVTEHADDEVKVSAEVIRLERNAAHPQVALNLLDGTRAWKKKVWAHAAETLAAETPDDVEDW